MKKKQIYPIIFLTCLTLAMIYVITPSSGIFGSTTDWLSQHINLADYFRSAILENKTPFLDYAFNLGGGQNIYNLSYYGLFRPDVLISCLLPSVSMKDIIIVYIITNLVFSVNLTYLWLKHKQFNFWLCLIGAVILLSSSLLFHSHRQIMFVDYMCFLLLALWAVDLYIEKNQSVFLTISVVGIILSSYFFSVSALVVIVSYYCFERYRFEKQFCFNVLIKLMKPLIIAIMISAILLLPTAYVMLENHQSGAGSLHLFELIIPRLDFNSLLYGHYGCGMTYIAWIGLVLGLKSKKGRGLSIWLLVVLFIPLVCFSLNGFLYARTKILIPFIPLIVYEIVIVLTDLKNQQIKLDLITLGILLLPLIKQPQSLFDASLCLLGIILYLRVSEQSIIILMITPLLISYDDNLKESFIHRDTYRQIMDLQHIKVENDGRMDIFKQPLNTVNLSNEEALRTTLYSSINNRAYSHFYYDILHNPISIKNRVALLANSNIFFQGMMGVKYLYSETIVPIGYQKIANNLYQNNDVLPLVYTSSNLYSKAKFKKLCFPYTLDTIYNNTVVATTKTNYQSKIKAISLPVVPTKQSRDLEITKLNNGYHINSKKESELNLALKEPLNKQILIIEFNLAKVKYQDTRDTSISINGIKNKLSSNNAAYPNHNEHFTYILSQNEIIENLKLSFSKGSYDLKNIKCYLLDYEHLSQRKQKINGLQGNYQQGKYLAKGTIIADQDGYLVTSFPYQKGYQIKIDNQIVIPECVNEAFVGAKISQGKHQITITFQAPLKKISMVITLVGIVLLVIQGRREHEKRA